MTRRLAPFLAACLLSAACTGRADWRSDGLRLSVSPEGRLDRLEVLAARRDVLPAGADASLMQLRVEGRFRAPNGARREGDRLALTFPGGLTATVDVRAAPTHLRFELTSIADSSGNDAGDRVDLVAWGPFPTTLAESIGETVGVVRGGGYAVGLQALNPKTLGGWPWNDNDAMPQIDVFESGDPNDLSEAGKREVLYRVEAAKPDTIGSTLQAYTRNRSRDRVVENWGYPRYVAPAFDDGSVVGSAIALFGAPDSLALETIGAIEVAEGLPHPTLGGIWAKTARSASAAYVILPFGESTIDEALDVVERAGLRYLYHGEPFETWGHFALRRDHFPGGVDGLAAAVARAEARGVHVGVHVLSNFITTNDPYVTPVPDPRLAPVGSSRLAGPVGVRAGEFLLESPDYFAQAAVSTLRTARVETELVRFGGISSEPPWRLTGVERGAFGTRAQEHAAGSTVALLADHAYRVFLTTPDLGAEMARTVADLFNRTGLRQISFDGLEGNRSTGMGNYGEILFTKAWFDALSPEVRSHYIADASRTSHFFWHLYTRMNWGEPWYAGFRESQTEYRMKNQAYFRRNYMPGMLGWFSFGAGTSLEDIEWMLARSAAWDAGYAFHTSFEALQANGRTDEVLALLGRWERARMAGAFSADQKRRMEDTGAEFHLEEAGTGAWTLTPVSVARATIDRADGGPGAGGASPGGAGLGGATGPGSSGAGPGAGPNGADLAVENRGPDQPLAFTITSDGARTGTLDLEIDGRRVEVTASLRAGEHLVYRGGPTAEVVSSSWRVLRAAPVDAAALRVGPGPLILRFELALDGPPGAAARIEVRLLGEPEPVPGR